MTGRLGLLVVDVTPVTHAAGGAVKLGNSVVGSVRLGGITGRVAHPAAPGEALAGGPQMVEVSRDGKRIYLTNSLYGSWDDQFYPDGVGSWFAKIDTDPAAGGRLRVDEKFFPRGDDFRGRRVHQVRLGGGDASSGSYCYPS